jgi:hypothetical protein
MCFHKYTHYLKCTTHVPLHTHMCPKNVAEDISRVIFCENYRAIRVNAARRLIKRKRLVLDGGLVGVRRRILVRRGRLRLKL